MMLLGEQQQLARPSATVDVLLRTAHTTSQEDVGSGRPAAEGI
jgi:hypothetical protein